MIGRKQYSKLEMALICWTVGVFGVHRMLMGYKNWWLQLITFGGLGVWMLIDLFNILMGRMKMANGEPLQ